MSISNLFLFVLAATSLIYMSIIITAESCLDVLLCQQCFYSDIFPILTAVVCYEEVSRNTNLQSPILV